MDQIPEFFKIQTSRVEIYQLTPSELADRERSLFFERIIFRKELFL